MFLKAKHVGLDACAKGLKASMIYRFPYLGHVEKEKSLCIRDKNYSAQHVNRLALLLGVHVRVASRYCS